MKRLRVPLALLLLLAFTLAPSAQDKAKPETKPEVYNYLLYFMGSRIGWMTNTVSQVELDGRQVRHEKEVGFVQIKRSLDNQVFETNSVTEYWYEQDGTLIKEVDTTTNGDKTQKLEVVYSKDHAVITDTINDGKPTTTKLEFGEKPVYSTFHAWLTVKEKGLKKGEQLKFWNVEDDEHTLLEHIWTISGKVKRTLSDKSTVEGTEIRMVQGGRAATAVIGDDDMVLLWEDAGGFTLERTKEIPDPFKAEEVTLRNVMKANVAMAEFKQLDQMDIHIEFEHDDGEGVEALVESNAYHDVIKYDKGYALRLKQQRMGKDFEAPKWPYEEVPEDVAKFLEPTAMCDSNDEVLAKKAAELIKRKNSAVTAARAIMRFTNDHLDDTSGATGAASARQAYDEGSGDCTEHAALFVALARAAGLPARNVGGFVYLSAGNGSYAMFGYHAWAEVWLGEWVPVDPTVDELGTSARYVFYEYDEPGESVGRSRISRSLRQDIQPVVDAYELSNGKSWKRKGAKEFEWE